ncbi:alpha/beta fold hydrolase [Hyalangium versicolor]|uniref:alpha/beta fold hydrolase n=1 Tax=Hyalangium versicolor TaxID=2861190 RepID=UPI001CCC1C25|nr:alpha/beta hydrolase [Hyalangium versicolor]
MTMKIGQLTAPNLTLEAANGVRYAYRRFGKNDGSATPLVCFVHYRANLDNWDPALVDALAEEREIILMDNVGVAGSSGRTPDTVTEMAHGAIAFVDALKLARVDLLGFSLGGFVAQEFALMRPHQVRRLVLAGTGPQGGEGMHMYVPEVLEIALREKIDAEAILTIFFEKSESSRAKGREFIARLRLRQTDRDVAVTRETTHAHLTAISTWGIPDASKLSRLAAIKQPTLVANGDNDIMVPTTNSYLMARHLANAQLRIYPDAGHAFLFQYPEEFAADVNRFLGR